jgi:hypothetical protein
MELKPNSITKKAIKSYKEERINYLKKISLTPTRNLIRNKNKTSSSQKLSLLHQQRPSGRNSNASSSAAVEENNKWNRQRK